MGRFALGISRVIHDWQFANFLKKHSYCEPYTLSCNQKQLYQRAPKKLKNTGNKRLFSKRFLPGGFKKGVGGSSDPFPPRKGDFQFHIDAVRCPIVTVRYK